LVAGDREDGSKNINHIFAGYMENEVNSAIRVLHAGGTILYPTDTIWGLGCDATNREAVDKVFAIKNRPSDKGLIIFVEGIDMLSNYVGYVPEKAVELITAASEPLTIIYPQAKNLASGIPANDGSVAVRIPRNQFCQTVLHRFKRPLVSTSANFANATYPRSFSDIEPEFISKVDHVVRLQQAIKEHVIPSKIIRIDNAGNTKLIRK
jgi:L-threonylcarbamoyladenylate synthase